MSNEECCNHLVAQYELAGIGGTVMCCMGRKVACASPVPGDVPGGTILKKCVIKHEERHFEDVECPSCNTVEYAGIRRERDQRKVECDAHRVESKCLEESLSLCAGNAQCVDWITTARAQNFIYANRKYNCGISQ